MLDRARIAQQLQAMTVTAYPQFLRELDEAVALWQEVAHDKAFHEQVAQAPRAWGLARGTELLGTATKFTPHPLPYSVISVDGSQIYPDRHQGIACCMINIGSVQFEYRTEGSIFTAQSEPELVFGKDETDKSIDFVNCYRTEQELRGALTRAQELSSRSAHPYATLVDGSLIFSYLSSKDPQLKEQFFASYLVLLEKFYEQRIPVAAYISLPQSKELVSLLRVALMLRHNMSMQQARAAFSLISDQHILQRVLTPGTRTCLFEHRSEIAQQYPALLKPYYFYLHTGNEIARVELPAWLAQDADLFARICAIIADQVEKGDGYPIALAEAHEQAVVTAVDRDYFYKLIELYVSEKHPGYAASRKSYTKRYVNC